MPMARYLAPFAAAMLLVLAVGCGSGKSSAELKAYEAEHPLGPFEDTDGDFSTTDTGLKYRVTREGTGAKPAVTDTVEVHYVGKLVDGTEFDSSYKRQLPTEFPLQKVVAGWTEGMQLVAEGGQIDLIIPSDLGYGPNGGGPIPPDATLYFTVELLDVKQQAQPSDDPSSSDPAIPTSPPLTWSLCRHGSGWEILDYGFRNDVPDHTPRRRQEAQSNRHCFSSLCRDVCRRKRV